MPTIQRGWGYTDDAVAGGSEYDDLVANNGGVIPDAVNFWPITGGSNDKNLDFIDRNNEARGRRAATARLPFRARGEMTVPVPTYRSVLEKAFRKTLGGVDTVVPGSGVGPQTHVPGILGFGSTPLPAVHAQLVRDDYNLKMSGSVFNRLSLTFPLDGQGTAEAQLMGMYFQNYTTPMPAAVFTGLSSEVMMLRDAQVFIDGSATVSEQQTLAITGTPTGGTFTLTFNGATTAPIAFNATSAAVVTALVALTTIGAAGVTATGGPLPTGVVITFAGVHANTDQPLLIPDASGLTGGTNPTTTISQTVQGGSGVPIPDLQGFEFSFTNNVEPKWYAKRNVVTRTLGTPVQQKRLWFPAENKVAAAQDVTYAINFGSTNVAQELAQDYAQIQKLVFEVAGGQLATTPVVNELLRITINNAVHGAGGGTEALNARDDITARFEGNGFYDQTAGADISVAIINASTAAIT